MVTGDIMVAKVVSIGIVTRSSLIKKEVDYDPPSLDDEPPLSDEPELGNSLGASALVQPLLIRLNGGAIAWSVITPEAELHVHCPGSGQAAAA